MPTIATPPKESRRGVSRGLVEPGCQQRQPADAPAKWDSTGAPQRKQMASSLHHEHITLIECTDAMRTSSRHDRRLRRSISHPPGSRPMRRDAPTITFNPINHQIGLFILFVPVSTQQAPKVKSVQDLPGPQAREPMGHSVREGNAVCSTHTRHDHGRLKTIINGLGARARVGSSSSHWMRRPSTREGSTMHPQIQTEVPCSLCSLAAAQACTA
jgi:hypothetical protein